jgi:excisionase family DNA binding protein
MKRLTIKEAAQYLRLAYSTLNRLRVKGGGPRYMRLGGKILYDLADLDAWTESNKRESEPVDHPGSA